MAVCQMGEWAGTDPVEQRRPVVSKHDVVERVAAMSFANASGRGQQVQVVVAKHDGGAIAQGPQPAQRRERMRSAIDQVAGKPERARVVGVGAMQERPQSGVAALQVADRQWLRGGCGRGHRAGVCVSVRYFWMIARAAMKLTAIAAIDPTATAMIADRGSAFSTP